MQQDEAYALIMLDLNSTNVDIKLNALEKINSLQEKERYIPALEKLTQSKENSLQTLSNKILRSIPEYKTKSLEKTDTTLDLSMSFESLKQQFGEIITLEDYEFFKPYFTNTGSKQEHITTDIREKIQRFLNSEDPVIKLKALLPILYLPLEHKYKVNLLVDLLRDQSAFVVSSTFRHLNDVDSLTAKKLVPIIINRLGNRDQIIVQEVMNYLLNVNKNMFETDLEIVKDTGLKPKIQKRLTDKLLSALS